jgi:hypothetical protein
MSLIACNNAFISNSNKILKGASSNIRGDISMLPGPSEILNSSGIQQYEFDKSTGNEGDKKFPEDIAIKSIRNGYYQHIYWLGVGGYLIINHHDKEFILIDPWHSYLSFWLNDFPFTINRPLNPNPRIDEVTRLLYESIHVQNGLNNQYDEWMNCLAIYRERVSSKVPLQSFEILNMDLIAINEKTKGNSSSQGNKYFERKSYIDELSHMVTSTIDGCLRLTDLANFIRNSVNLKPDGSCDYTFSGILLSHMHFDHGDDLAMLLTLLCVGGGHYVDALTNLDFGILQGPALIQKKPDGTDVNHMPKIYCDFETIFYYKTMYFGVEPGPNVHPHYQKFIETFTNYNFYKNKYGESRLNVVYGGSNEKWHEIVAKKNRCFTLTVLTSS